MERSFDLIVFGATGFTGHLVAEYVQATYGAAGELRWALAGRDAAKLARVRDAIGARATLPLLTADASDVEALAALAARTRVILTTVGPYQLHGETLVLACAQAGTDYVDLCGEPAWMAKMIPRLQPMAAQSGARIVFSCGFDSIPFDLGVLFLQDEALHRFGRPLPRVRGRVRVLKGGPSGGTIASLLATIEQMRRDPSVARTMADPFALTPGFSGPAQPEGESASYDQRAQSWTGPFVMAPINTKNVHRTNALLGHPWGRDFVYDERMLTGDGAKGEARARRLVRQARGQNLLLAMAPTRALLRRFALPKPGEGPNAQARENGPLRARLHRRDDGRRPAARPRNRRPRPRLWFDLEDDQRECSVPRARCGRGDDWRWRLDARCGHGNDPRTPPAGGRRAPVYDRGLRAHCARSLHWSRFSMCMPCLAAEAAG
jgi:short subunit dehydrogenase-like uncharacterized protein